MSIIKDLPELVEAEVISQETLHKIQDYYNSKKSHSSNRLLIVFGILGAILIGLGIILIIAHNWDDFSRTTKTIFSFLPLIIGQILCGYTLLKKSESEAMRESSTAFLFLSVGASISLISQVYNIPGDLSSFLLTWMLMCLPLIYVMKSSIGSILYIIGITTYACEVGYWQWFDQNESYIYWLLILGVLPHYYLLYKKDPKSNFLLLHNWIIPISLIITLGTIARHDGELMFIAYFSLFGLFYLAGNFNFFSQGNLRNNPYLILGSLGTIVLLLPLSFDWFWEHLDRIKIDQILTSPEIIGSTIISLIAIVLLYIQQKNKSISDLKPTSITFILFIITFIIGISSPILAILIINIILLATGIITIREGARQNHLGILNYGLLIITALIICRFFDININFVIKGLLFVMVGVGFVLANYWMIKKRKSNEQK